MLVNKLVMWPFGCEDQEYEIAKIVIYNTGTASYGSGLGNYKASIEKDEEIVATCEINDFPRTEKDAVDLLYLSLKTMIKEYRKTKKRKLKNKKVAQR